MREIWCIRCGKRVKEMKAERGSARCSECGCPTLFYGNKAGFLAQLAELNREGHKDLSFRLLGGSIYNEGSWN